MAYKGILEKHGRPKQCVRKTTRAKTYRILPLPHKARLQANLVEVSKIIFSRGKTKAKASQTGPTEQEVYWPLDLLPNDCTNARIFTWGYDSVVAKFFRGPTNQNNIFAHAKDLLYLLSNKRLGCVGFLHL